MSEHAPGVPVAPSDWPEQEAARDAVLRAADGMRGWRVLTRSRVHDLRGRLNAANLLLDLLLGSVPAAMELDGDQRETWTRHLSTIRSELRAVADTLGDLVPPAADEEEPVAAVDPAQLVDELVSGLWNLAGKQRVTFDTRLPSGLQPILTRPNRLRQAVLDVLLDSLDALEHGGVLCVEAEDAPEALRILVRSEPAGATSRRGAPADGGAGELRRRVAHRILQGLGGRLRPLSGAGGGSFVVELPREPLSTEAKHAARTAG